LHNPLIYSKLDSVGVHWDGHLWNDLIDNNFGSFWVNSRVNDKVNKSFVLLRFRASKLADRESQFVLDLELLAVEGRS